MRTRQIGLLVGAIVFLILIVIAFRGCLDARKDRSFENYVSDLSAITAENQQLSDGFFESFSGKSSSDEIGLSGELNTDKGTAQGLLDRAEALDAPDELGAAQEQIALAFELRHDAIEGIASQIDSALGNSESGSKKAAKTIYTQMKVLSASDILYARARDQIEQGLEDQGITIEEGVPQSKFLPESPDYLDPSVVDDALVALGGSGSGSSGSQEDPKDGLVHGLGLQSSTLLPSGTALVDGGSVTATTDDTEIEIAVQNQGEADEGDIDVDVESSGGGPSGSQTISTIAPGDTQTVTIPLRPAPSSGDTVDLTVTVATVGGEEVADNNEATYSIAFE